VHVDGSVARPQALSVADLRRLPQHTVLCALQCAGNRRHAMRTRLREVCGIDWFDQALMNCAWRGPRLADVLALAGVRPEMRDGRGAWAGFVVLACYETPCQDDGWFGAGVELARVMDPDGDVLLALEMNGRPLSAERGAPVRAIAPGVAGARSVKWLNRVTVQLTDCSNYYQTHDYKILPPEADSIVEAKKWWGLVKPMMDLPVNSIVGLPKSGTTVVLDEKGMVEVKGYAVPAGGKGPVKSVEVSGDGGKSWVQAELDFGGHDVSTEEGRRKVRWTWCLWRARVKLARGEGRRIVSRAVDWGDNEQSEHGQWNIRGVGFNAWGMVQELNVE